MSIRCGHCKDRHPSIADVRACSARAKRQEPATEGIYVVNGTVYKVKRAIHGSGRLYAVAYRGGQWVKEDGMVNQLRPADRMTLEAAAEYGRLYGRCVRCQTPLTDENSIRAGIGPVCATKL